MFKALNAATKLLSPGADTTAILRALLTHPNPMSASEILGAIEVDTNTRAPIGALYFLLDSLVSRNLASVTTSDDDNPMADQCSTGHLFAITEKGRLLVQRGADLGACEPTVKDGRGMPLGVSVVTA